MQRADAVAVDVEHLDRVVDAVLLVEQQIQRALQVAHTAYILESGANVLSGTTVDLSRHEHVKRVYLGM